MQVLRPQGRSSFESHSFKARGAWVYRFVSPCEDQFDFHNYCLRKTTLRTYVGMLRMQDRLFSHKFYRRAAKDHQKPETPQCLVNPTSQP
eukprot:6484498-Amphidinium_carterae.1